MKLNKYISLLIIMLLSTFAVAQSQDFPSFDEELSNRIELYPNPAVDVFNVEIKESNLVKPTVVIYNIIGTPVEVEIEKIEDNKFQLSVRNLPNGYYLVSVKDQRTKFSKTYKFLKK